MDVPADNPLTVEGVKLGRVVRVEVDIGIAAQKPAKIPMLDLAAIFALPHPAEQFGRQIIL